MVYTYMYDELEYTCIYTLPSPQLLIWLRNKSHSYDIPLGLPEYRQLLGLRYDLGGDERQSRGDTRQSRGDAKHLEDAKTCVRIIKNVSSGVRLSTAQ